MRQLNARNLSAAFFRIVHASLMSQESQKFPLGSIFPVFCESHLFETQTPFQRLVEILGILLLGGVWGGAGRTPAFKTVPTHDRRHQIPIGRLAFTDVWDLVIAAWPVRNGVRGVHGAAGEAGSNVPPTRHMASVGGISARWAFPGQVT